jgi:hypothetical protein
LSGNLALQLYELILDLFPFCTEFYIHHDRSLNGATNNTSFWIFSSNIVVGIATCYAGGSGVRTPLGGEIFGTHPEARLVLHTVCTRPLSRGKAAET